MSAVLNDAMRPSPASASDAVDQWRFDARVHTGFATAEKAWRRIESGGLCTPFQRLDWAKAIVAHAVGTEASDVLVVEAFEVDSERPLVLIPLVRRSNGIWTSLAWLGADVCDYCAPLLAADVEWTPAAALAAWNAIRAVLPRADLLRIDRIPSFVGGALNPFMLLGRTCISASTTCGLRVHGDPKTVVERCCDPSFVKKLGKTGRRLAARGTVRFVEARTTAEVDEIFGALLQQRLSRFTKLDRFDLIGQPHVAAFYRAAAIEGLHGGAVRLLGLRVGEQWVGTYYGLMQGGAFQGLIVTIADESWKNCSPGLHVHAHVIRWLSEKGLAYFDMSVGPAVYKDQIGGRRRVLYSFDHALSVRGHLILSAFFVLAKTKAQIRKRPKLRGLAASLRARANDLADIVRLPALTASGSRGSWPPSGKNDASGAPSVPSPSSISASA